MHIILSVETQLLIIWKVLYFCKQILLNDNIPDTEALYKVPIYGYPVGILFTVVTIFRVLFL